MDLTGPRPGEHLLTWGVLLGGGAVSLQRSHGGLLGPRKGHQSNTVHTEPFLSFTLVCQSLELREPMKGALWDTGMRHGGIFLDLVCQEAFCHWYVAPFVCVVGGGGLNREAPRGDEVLR